MDVPAVCGLRNQGNTCFVNAVIQCLSNAELFSEYLVGDYYKIDRKKHCKINSRNRASRGEVTEQLANLLKCLWSLRSHSDAAHRFKQVVCRYGPQFGDSAQHDAQEFLLWLLDTVHEDLNLVCRKHTKKNAPASGRIQDISPQNSSLADHLRYNNSFVHDLFQSQVRSSLSCICGRQSSTVDPLLCFSIPIPSSPLSTVLVRVSFFHRHPRRTDMSVSVDTRATVRELRDRISRQTRIPEKRLVLMRCDPESGVAELADDSLSLQQILCDVQVIHAIETSPPKAEGTEVLDLVIVNRNEETKQVFGPFFQSCISRSSSFRKIQLELLQSLSSYLKHSLDLKSLAPDDICVRVVVDSHESDQLPADVDHPLYMPIVDKAIAICEEKGYRGPVHLNLILDWKPKIMQTIFVDLPARSPGQSEALSESTLSIYDCLDLYFREEKLQDEDAWLCPSCQKRTISTKKLSMWTLPDLLIIHLKRFRQSPTIRSKLSTPVTYPLTELDMSPYVDDRNEGRSGSQNTLSRWGNRLSSSPRARSRSVGRDSYSLPSRWVQPWKRPALRWNRLNQPGDSRCSTYDLVAVCNHTGSLLSGHYTATCRNPVNLQWYHFDDTAVSPVKESEVSSPNAYLLFYQRCNLSPTNSCDSAYLSSASHDSRPSDRHSRSTLSRDTVSFRQTAVSSDGTDASGMRWSRSREDVRGSFPYATIPPAKTARSFCKLIFRRKERDSSLVTDREKAPLLERRVRPEGPLRGLTVILPPEESQTSRRSKKPDSPDQQTDESTRGDRLFWTVTSV